MAEVGRYGYNNGDLGGVQDGYGGYLTRHTAAANYVPNTWGLYDMHGNVWEWCLDWHEDDLGVDPVSDPIGGDTGTYRALRGGSWDYNAGLCRSAFRGTHTPPYSSSAGGFRVSFSSTHLVVDLASGDVLHLSRVPADLLTNADYKTTKMVFRRIPAGTFTMGSPTDELGRFADSEFQHQVTLTKDFYIGVFEVTQAQYKAVMSGADPSAYKGDHRPVEMVSWNTVRGGDWPNGDPGTDTFMDKLRTLTGDALPFDLPTEAQWEYACRAGTSRAYNDYTQNGGTGSDCLTTGEGQDTNLDPLAWYRYNAAWQFLEHQEVGTKQANTWGLYDMHGNVYEWCLDWYVADLGVDLVVDPVGGDTGSARVGRSGSWNGDAKGCRSANRNYGPPSTSATTLGFRAALAPR
jgi:formylglycine-generating enzyme required for sulfatase activity